MILVFLSGHPFPFQHPKIKKSIQNRRALRSFAATTPNCMNEYQAGKWEKRWNPLKREWVHYAAHRNNRPWSFAPSKHTEVAPEYVADCYLCPGNARVHGTANPNYEGVYVFNNDHPVVGENCPTIPEASNFTNRPYLFKKGEAKGLAKVICYDPRHNVTMGEMPLKNVVEVFKAWRQQTQELSQNPAIKSVLIFENKGEIVGVSNPHPHCQIYAFDVPFNFFAEEHESALEFKALHHKNLFEEIVAEELEQRTRVIAENDFAVAFIPFFATYAYETMIFPKTRHKTLISMSDEELAGLAAVFQTVVQKLDKLFQMSFPYVMAFHQAPFPEAEFPEYHCYMSILPPLRQPGIKKFPAGPEIGAGNFMSDTMPEDKAKELQNINLG